MLGARTAFTLIEMLTVLAIMGIMLGIGVPAITNIMKSGGLSVAARQVSNAMSQARQYAITQRVNTRVVFPFRTTLTTATVPDGTNQAPVYQSYAVLAIGSTTHYLSKWEHLPVGTVFMDNNTFGSPSVDILGPPVSLPFPSTNFGSSATLSYIEFTPTGAASQAGSFTITEGFVNGGAVTPTSKTITSLVNAAVIAVDNIVGRVRVIRP